MNYGRLMREGFSGYNPIGVLEAMAKQRTAEARGQQLRVDDLLPCLCPANLYGSSLVKIPAPGTEDDDHNPPRIASRNLFDIAIGHDNVFHGERYKWSARIAVTNLTNRQALYNFLSTFSGTHYVAPRAITGSIAFHF